MVGHRLSDDAPLSSTDAGAYVLRSDTGTWDCVTPNGHLGNLGNHDVTEHEDGTITVSPSILVSDNSGELWHGFLERGVWREC